MSQRHPDGDVRDWLGRRESAAPVRLVTRMRAALDRLDAEPEDTPSALGSAALTCLRDALANGDRREAALDLLAADALLTYGCEAAAEAGADALERFANDYGAARLAALLPEGGTAAPPPSGNRAGTTQSPPASGGRRGGGPHVGGAHVGGPHVGGAHVGGPHVGGQLGPRSRTETSPAAADSIARHLRRLASTAEAVAAELAGRIADVAAHVTHTFERGGKLLFCGNGGSAADAQHLATEYMVRFRCARRPLPAIALTTDTSLLTAASNDLGFDQVFARQVHALGREGDLLFLHSTSGNSANLLAAASAARECGVTTAALLARDGGKLKDAVDYAIVLPTDDGAHAQELHLAIGHAICEIVERMVDG